MSSLIVTEHDVRRVKAPPATDTWQPFPHAVLLDELEQARAKANQAVSHKRYELSKDGQQFFGAWIFDANSADNSQPQVSIGFRNSINKSLSVGITAGTHIMVCSNMAFSGDWIQFRKHTRNVLVDLHTFVGRAFEVAFSRAANMVGWQQNLDTIDISPNDWKILTYDAIKYGVVAPSKLDQIFSHRGQLTLGIWFNIITNVLSQRSLIHTEDSFANLMFMVREYLNPDDFI